jgi:hypothetical protein
MGEFGDKKMLMCEERLSNLFLVNVTKNGCKHADDRIIERGIWEIYEADNGIKGNVFK